MPTFCIYYMGKISGGGYLKRTTIVFGILLCLIATLSCIKAGASSGEHHIIINLPEFRLHHYIGEELINTYPISIGNINTPTPVSSATRRFEIYNKVVDPWWKSPTTGVVVPPGPTNPLGTRWLGLMTIDKVTLTATDTWESLAKRYGASVGSILSHNGLKVGAKIVPGTQIEIPHHDGYGIHGTTAPHSIGTSVSMGCMRMRKADVEQLFDILPNGKRIPVVINYSPIIEQHDPITNETYYKFVYDVYRRIKDYPAAVANAAKSIGANVYNWLSETLNQHFNGSYLLSSNPAIYNNGELLVVGALKLDNGFFIPSVIAERLTGLNYAIQDDIHYLGPTRIEPESVVEHNNMFYLHADLLKEYTGRSPYYEPMLNSLEFGITRLTIDGNIISYGRVLVHPTMEVLVPVQDVCAVLGLEITASSLGRVEIGETGLTGEQFGELLYVSPAELKKLGLMVTWHRGSGELALVSAETKTER